MNDLPFNKPGKFYRGNLHTHSTCSDGALSPEAVVKAYRDEGYDFIALTDHFLENYNYPLTDTRPYRSAEFTTLIGAELHGPEIDLGGMWHFVAAGLPLDFEPPREGETGPDIAVRAAAAGAFVGAAHPAWYGLTMGDLGRVLGAVDAIEVYNETCAELNDRGDSWAICDALLAQGHRVTAYAADDAHFGRHDYFGAWVQVRSESLEPELLLRALKAGQYYSSQGPEIKNLCVEDGCVHIESSPVRAVFMGSLGARSERQLGTNMTRCTLPLERFQDSYCRITLVDAAGKRAWTNPIWL